MVTWHDPDRADDPAAAIVLEFAPVLVAPAEPQTETSARARAWWLSDAFAQPADREPGGKDRGEDRAESRGEARAEGRREARHQAGRRAAAGSCAGARSGGRDPAAAAAGGQAGDAETAGRRGLRRLRRPRSQAIPEADGSDSGCADARQTHAQQFERGADLENAGRRCCWSATIAIPETAQSTRRDKASCRFSSASIGKGTWSTAGSCVHPASPCSTRRRWRCCAARSPFRRLRAEFPGDPVTLTRADPLQPQVTFPDLKR